MANLNPQIRSIEIGTRVLSSITIYPLSLADQFKLSDIITEGVAEYERETAPTPALNDDGTPKFYEGTALPVMEEPSDVSEFSIIAKLIEENLITILNLVTDLPEPISLADLSNDQFADLCDIIYEVNYASAAGKLKALWNRVKGSFQLSKPSPKSSAAPLTVTNTSSTSPIVEEE